jgi:hypothetical protein
VTENFKSSNAVSTAIRKASAGQDCTLRIPGICRHDPAYTVGAHLRIFHLAGIAQKPDDLFIVDACDRCHDALDRRGSASGITMEDILMAFIFTLRRRRAAGLITLKGEKT